MAVHDVDSPFDRLTVPGDPVAVRLARRVPFVPV